MRTGVAMAWLFVVVSSPQSGLADDKPVERAELERRAAKAAFSAATTGTELFNGGKADECYRLYQGALMALLPMLDHQPKVVAVVQEKLEKAKGMRAADGAFVLREALDAVMAAARPSKPLWDRLGGERGVRAVVHEVVIAAAGDPKVNFTRGGAFKPDEKAVARLEQLLVEFISSATGGPLKYTGRDMVAAHKGQKVTDAEFDALVGHVEAALKKASVPQADVAEFLEVVGATRKAIVEVPRKPLWDRLGGERGVRAVTREFLATAAKDPKVNVDRNGNYPLTKERAERVEQLLVEMVSSATGGPLKYTGRDMKNSHAGMRVTEDEFNAAAGHLIAALKKFEVPQPEIDELIAIIATTKKDIVEVPKK